MPKTSYKVALPDGTFATRKSDRVYTHIVVGRTSHEYAVAQAAHKDWAKTDKSNYAHYLEVLAGKWPQRAWRTEPKWTAEQVAEELAQNAVRDARDKAAATEKLSGCANANDYADKCQRERLAMVAKAKAEGKYDVLIDLAWCGRFDLAQKQVAQHSARYIDLAIVEVA